MIRETLALAEHLPLEESTRNVLILRGLHKLPTSTKDIMKQVKFKTALEYERL